MTLTNLLKRSEKLIVDNSPAILTSLGVVGTVSTAILTGKAAYEAALVLESDINSASKNYIQTPKRKLELTWPLFIPASLSGISTIFVIIAANRIGTRRATAITTAYFLSEKAFEEYRQKVIETIGDKKEEKIRGGVAQDSVNAKPTSDSTILITGSGTVLCYESYTGRYFESSMEALRKAANNVNARVINNYYASLSDFYAEVGLPNTKISDDIGWNVDSLLELQFSTVLSEDQRPCLAIDFRTAPIRNYYRIN